MKALAIIINIFFPGIGTLIIGKVGRGITQFLLYFLGAIMVLTGLLAIIGIPLCIGIWIWSIISVASSEAQPVKVVIEQTTTESKNDTQS